MIPEQPERLSSHKLYEFPQPGEINQTLVNSQEQFILNKGPDGKISLHFLDGDHLNHIDVTEEYRSGISNNSTFEDFQKKIMESRFQTALSSVTARTTTEDIKAAATSVGPVKSEVASSSAMRQVSPEAQTLIESRKRAIDSHFLFHGSELSYMDTKGRFANLYNLANGGQGEPPKFPELPYDPSFDQNGRPVLMDERGRMIFTDENGKALLDDISPPPRSLVPFPKVPGRFTDIFCPQATCVKVGNEVLHANHVRLGNKDFICTEAPRKHTIPLFWRAAMQNTNFILDLTNIGDVGKGVVPYFPELGEEPFRAPDPDNPQVKVECLEQHEIENHITLSKYKVTDLNSEPPKEKVVTRLHYRGWPDYGAVPSSELNKIIELVDKFKTQAGGGPAMVHCRAGVGRTGTTCVGDVLREKIKSGEVTRENYQDAIDKLILQGRFQRSRVFVQSQDQYESIHLLALDLLKAKAEGTL